jgi:hypothetical protein
MTQRLEGSRFVMWLALQRGNKRLPGTSAGVAMTQRLEGSRFVMWLALQRGSKRLPGTSAGVAMTQALGGEPLCNVVSSAAWQQAAPGNVCRCRYDPARLVTSPLFRTEC